MMSGEGGEEEMEPFTMITTEEEAGTAGLMGTFRSGKTWIQVQPSVSSDIYSYNNT